jgi:hypothetical protein
MLGPEGGMQTACHAEPGFNQFAFVFGSSLVGDGLAALCGGFIEGVEQSGDICYLPRAAYSWHAGQRQIVGTRESQERRCFDKVGHRSMLCGRVAVGQCALVAAQSISAKRSVIVEWLPLKQ